MKYIFFIALLLNCSSLDAKIVSLTSAQETAEKFWGGNKTRSSSRGIHYVCDNRAISGTAKTRSSSEPLFYVFAGVENNGFVIVSAEDQIIPILAYSFVDIAPQIDNLPESLIDWINTISDQIEYVRTNSLTNSNASRMWANTGSGNTVIELETAKWNQHKPYNNQCPLDGAERCLVGCVPVATAIVMKYHNWPQSGKGYTDSYTTKTKGIYVASRNLNHVYNWEEMPMIFTNNEYSNEAADEVSTLMADIGAAFQADFRKESTPCSLNRKQLYEHFGYNPAMSEVQRKDYSNVQWITMLKNEIHELRPVLYSGHGNSGHQFVLDGYTDDDYFHVNWGWGGSSNGYYTLSNLVPDDRGGYNDDQWACFNVKPSTSSEVEDWKDDGSHHIVDKGMISFKPLNDTYDAIKAPSTDERKKKINRKRRNEIIHAAKFLYEKCKHYKCEVFSMEDLCFKDDKKKKKNGKKKKDYKKRAANRLNKNQWCRTLLVEKLTKHVLASSTRLQKVQPQYSSIVGNIVYRKEKLPDPVLASIEIGRRG